jgi:hypothetical protein
MKCPKCGYHIICKKCHHTPTVETVPAILSSVQERIQQHSIIIQLGSTGRVVRQVIAVSDLVKSFPELWVRS